MAFNIKITAQGPVLFTDEELEDRTAVEEILKKMDSVTLRALIRNKAHNLDNQMQRYILNPERTKIVMANTRKTLRFALDAWEKRGHDMDKADINYAYDSLRRGEEFDGSPIYHESPPHEPFNESDLKAVERVIFERRSVRRFSDKDVPDEILDKVLEAGTWAPNACSVQGPRFIVVKNPETMKLTIQPWSAPILVVGCVDERPYKLIEGAELPYGPIIDLAAAIENMHLMAQALGLGMTIGTFIGEIDLFRRALETPDYINPTSYFVLGWPVDKPTRVPRMELKGFVSREKWEGE
jgi:nitroreductase